MNGPCAEGDDTEVASTSEGHECKVCHAKFDSLQSVLKHDLLTHATGKKKRKLPGHQLKRKVNEVLKTINGEDEKKFRQDLAEAISECAIGTELDVIFKKHTMANEDLAFVYTRIHSSLEAQLNKIGLFSIEKYGSIANGLALKSSDIDLYISSQTPQINSNTAYRIITKMLFRSNRFSDIIPIRKARVPIIKCIHRPTGFNLDINTCEPYGVHNTKFINNITECDTRIHQLMLFLKIWSKSTYIYRIFNLTNYCLITLVIFFLQNSDPPVLSSVKTLQHNAPNCMVNGVNFGVNLRGVPLDATLNIEQLIQGFFKFYHNFDFEYLIIAPYLGKAIKRVDFESGAFEYPEYQAQLRMFATIEEVEILRTDRPACVQDMFCLNVNVGRCLTETNIQYFKKCATVAHQKCSDPMLSQKNLYKSLLSGIIEQISEILPQDVPASGDTLAFDIIPRKTELKSLVKFTENRMDLQKMWTKQYIDAIVQIITEVYRIDMTPMSPTRNTKCKKIDETEENATPPPSKWSINCYVDLWSGRQMQRNIATPFMDYQLAQTEKLHAERRQNSNFAVQFKGYLSISVINNYSALRVEVSSTKTLCKKDPLRKFFGILKCSIQNYNLKHRIHQLETQTE